MYIKYLETEFWLNNIQNFGSYLAYNVLLLCYKINRLMLFREIIALYSENHTKCTKYRIQSLKKLKRVVYIVITVFLRIKYKKPQVTYATVSVLWQWNPWN
jgi:hypothetical protein